MEMFHAKLYHGSLELWTPADVVQHSFIVQESLTPLCLELSKSYIVWDGYTDSDYPSYSYSKDFIDTVEKCRKVFSKNRNLLYTLHLDLPRGREKSLKTQSPEPENVQDIIDWETIHLGKISVVDDFYPDIVYSLVDVACERTDSKLKVLKWLVTFEFSEKSLFNRIPLSIINHCFDCMDPDLDDSEFVTECFKKIDLFSWITVTNNFKPEQITNVFYQLHRTVWKTEFRSVIGIFTDFCLSPPTFHLVGDVLRFRNSPSFCFNLYQYLLENVYSVRDMLLSRKDGMSPQRHSLLLQFFWIYFNKSENLDAANEFLRLIWNSVPDSLLTLNEIREAYGNDFPSSVTEEIYDFYSEAVRRERWWIVEPRSLKHYCRTTIRRRLYERRQWLPEGIKQMGLPEKLQSYLNLEG